MNKGLRLATGDVIGFLNADDMYAADDVLAKVSALMQQGGLDALYGDTEFVRPPNLHKPVRRYRSNRFRPDLHSNQIIDHAKLQGLCHQMAHSSSHLGLLLLG